MAFCRHCGTQIGDMDAVCRACGVPTGLAPVQQVNAVPQQYPVQGQVFDPNNPYQVMPVVVEQEQKSIVLPIVLAIVIPIAVIVLILILILTSSTSAYLNKAKRAASSVASHNSHVSSVANEIDGYH